MAVKLLKKRIIELKNEVLAKLDELESVREGEKKEARLEDLKKKFYSIAIYDLIGMTSSATYPVYLVGLRLRYVLDEDVIDHIKATPKTGHELNEKFKIVQGPNISSGRSPSEGTKKGIKTEVHIPDPPEDKKE